MYVIPCLDVDSEKLRGEARKRAHASGAFMGYFGMLGAAHRYAKAAGLESDERSLRDENKSPWHSLRHTFGVELARAGVGIEDIAELMGHADIETARIYTKFASNARTKAEAIARAFNNRT
jgi:integrase